MKPIETASFRHSMFLYVFGMQGTPPISTLLYGPKSANPSPVIVTTVPPFKLPVAGVIELTVNAMVKVVAESTAASPQGSACTRIGNVPPMAVALTVHLIVVAVSVQLISVTSQPPAGPMDTVAVAVLIASG
jgi:hypothetical protein